MTQGVPPNDIFHNGVWYNRTGGGGVVTSENDPVTGGLRKIISGVAVDSDRLLGRNIVCIGDSITELNGSFGWPFSALTAAGGGPACVRYAWGSVDTPTGTGTLAFDGTSMTWSAAGETASAAVNVSAGGVFKLYSSGGSYLRVGITASQFAGSFNVSGARGATMSWQRNTGAWMYVADAITGHRLNWINLGIGGNTSVDVAARYQQALDASPSVVVDFYGTNDIVAAARTPEAYVATRVANWAKVIGLGIPVIACLITPRSDGSATTALCLAITKANKLLVDAARARPGVYIADGYSGSVDPTSASGAPRSGYMGDGLHFGPDAGFVQGASVARILNVLFPAEASATPPMVGALALYNAATNPGGNLIPSGHGSFIGSGGTAGAGMSGTIPAGWNWARTSGSAMTGVGAAVAATDGGADWWALTVASAAATETVRGYPDYLTIGNLATGDSVEISCEFEISGTGCTGVYLDLLGDGAMSAASGIANMCLKNTTQNLSGKFVLATEPVTWLSTSVTSALPRIWVQSAAGGSFIVRMRNCVVRKI